MSEGTGTGTGTGGEEGKEQLTFQATAFESLERDFREVLHQMVGDKTLERFKAEYEKLHNTLKKSHENENKLIKKCKELNKEIVANAARIQTALRLSLQDQNSITLLRNEIDNAWKMVDEFKEKEKRARDNVNSMKQEILDLNRLVEQGAGVNIHNENAVTDLMQKNQNLEKELKNVQDDNAEYKERVEGMLHRQEDMETKCHNFETQIATLQEKNSKLKSEKDQLTRRANETATKLKHMQRSNENVESALNKLEVDHKHLQQNYEEKRLDLAKEKGHSDDLEEKIHNLENDKDVAVSDIRRLKERVDKKEGELKEKKKQFDKLKKELREKGNTVDQQGKSITNLEKSKKDLMKKLETADKYRDWLKTEMKQVLRSLENQRKDTEADDKKIQSLIKQIQKLSKQTDDARKTNDSQSKKAKEDAQRNRSLEEEVKSVKKAKRELGVQADDAVKAKQNADKRASALDVKRKNALQTIKLKDNEIAELNKSLAEEKVKLKEQRNLYERVRSDRNLYSKMQVQSADEIAEMKRKFKIMIHQIDQLKEEIQAKDNRLLNEHFQYLRLQDSMKVYRSRLKKRKEVLETAQQVLKTQDAEIKNLRRTLSEVEADQHMHKRIYDDVVQERDILGTQLIRRNDELALLYEKIRIQQTILSKGEVQYRHKLNDIRQLQLELTKLKRLLQIRSHEVTNIEALKNEVYHVQRELLQERTKVKALSEELENPMNVHRWRALGGEDPDKLELIAKIRTLQKRLIKKTEEVVEKDLLIKDKDKLLADLKSVLSRQPGPEVAEQLSVYQHSLKEKTRQMKAMTAELNMFQAQVSEYRVEMERTARELGDVKRRYFEHKRRDQIAKDNERTDDPSRDPIVQQHTNFQNNQPKITGGGFNLTQRTKLGKTANAKSGQGQPAAL